MQLLPNKRVLTFGDFNIDLFKQESEDFESNICGNNMIPLISLANHFKPDCEPSVIDNILTNSTENLIMQVFLRVEFRITTPFPALLIMTCQSIEQINMLNSSDQR